MIVFVFVVLWQWIICLSFLDLRSPFKKDSAESHIGREPSSKFCVISLSMWSHTFVFSSTCDTTIFSYLSSQKLHWPDLNCFVYSVASVAFARHVYSLCFIQKSMSLNSDMHMLGSVDHKNFWTSLMIRIAVWPENMCQWNCVGVSMIVPVFVKMMIP